MPLAASSACTRGSGGEAGARFGEERSVRTACMQQGRQEWTNRPQLPAAPIPLPVFLWGLQLGCPYRLTRHRRRAQVSCAAAAGSLRASARTTSSPPREQYSAGGVEEGGDGGGSCGKGARSGRVPAKRTPPGLPQRCLPLPRPRPAAHPSPCRAGCGTPRRRTRSWGGVGRPSDPPRRPAGPSSARTVSKQDSCEVKQTTCGMP